MPRVLVVDDDRNLLKLIGTLLCSRGYEVVGTPAPHDAFEMLRRDSFDLIILDSVMPEFSGMDLINAFKVLVGFNTPVLMLSSKKNPISFLKTIEMGACDSVSKPFRSSIFLEKVKSTLSARLRTQ
jgi:DNA-binding response OmpR family regulator